MWRLTLFMVMVNGPLAGVLLLDLHGSVMSERKARKARAKGRCQRRIPSLPGGVCGQPIVARFDLLQGYVYRFHEWVCEEHTRDARLRARGFTYRVEDAAPVGG